MYYPTQNIFFSFSMASFDYFSNLHKKTNFSDKELIDKLEAIENEKNIF
jgi:hypothetical protein